MAVPLRQVWTLTVHSYTSVKHKKEKKSSLRRKYGFGLLQYWIISLISKLLDAFSTKNKKGDTTVDEESHMSKMKSWLGKYDKRDIIGQIISQITFCSSPCCQQYNSYDVSSENLVLDQLIIPKLIFFFLLIPYLVDIVLIVESQRGFLVGLTEYFIPTVVSSTFWLCFA